MSEDSSMPPNFSWVVDGLLAASAYPSTAAHYRYMEKEGITTLVSLTQRKANPGGAEFEVLHIGMPDFTPPSVSQVQQFLDIVESCRQNRKALLVHCQMGCGRTGTMCACYLITQGVSASQAVKDIRRMRPGSIETQEQERLVHTFEKHMSTSKQS